MEYLLIPRSTSLLTYPDDPVRYASSCQITKLTDDRATIHSLHGGDFYELLKARGLKPFKDLGVRVVEVAVKPAHMRLIRIALRDLVEVRDLGPATVGGQTLRWVEISSVDNNS